MSARLSTLYLQCTTKRNTHAIWLFTCAQVVRTNVARYEGNLGEIKPMPKETVSAVGGGVVQ
jgi:hypothetical protein